MFTVEQRDALRERVLRLAEEDDRVEAGAAVGSLAVDEGDRFSDLDLTFAVTDYVAVADVLDEWTTTLVDELGAVQLDLERDPTIYRVFLLPDALQFDLSLTPATRFRPGGPRLWSPCRREVTTRFHPTLSPVSTQPSPARSSGMRCAPLSPRASVPFCTRVRRQIWRTRKP